MGRQTATTSRGLTGEQISALKMLAGSPNGCTEPILRAHGFTVGLLASLVRKGFAVATPEAGGRTLGVVRLAITETGRVTVGA